MIDTLAKKLAASGVPQEQAEALKDALFEGRDRLASVADVRAETRPLPFWLGINTALSLAILGKLLLD